jgi:hypothetical protein
MRKVLAGTGLVLGLLVLALVLLFGYWFLRPNRSEVSEALVLETWDAVNDGTHNSNTDLIYWNDAFLLVYASSPFHFASEESRLHVLRSVDAQDWEELTSFDAAGEDIRDPKFAAIGERLLLYALKNTEFTAEPYQTVYAASENAVDWTAFQEMEPRGWLFWRPKTPDGVTWYLPAYWHEHNRSALLRSTDGVDWLFHAPIYEGDRNDETAVEFLPDGRMIATARLEVSDAWTGHPEGGTVIAVAEPPFENWTPRATSPVTRLDGPSLFTYNGRVYAVGRYQPQIAGPFGWQGSIFSRKRTSLFLVTEESLVYLSDLPSAGDTSYSGVVLRGDDLYVSYYTSDVDRDYPWILGMVSPSSVRMARIDLPSLEALALSRLHGANP